MYVAGLGADEPVAYYSKMESSEIELWIYTMKILSYTVDIKQQWYSQ